MADEATGELLLGADMPADRREAVASICRREREVAVRHPWIVHLASTGVRLGPNMLRHAEESVAALESLGLEPREAREIVAAVNDYVSERLIRAAREVDRPRRQGFTDAEREVLMQLYFQALIDSGGFPRIAPLLREGIPVDASNFERGVAWLLDGIELTLQARRGLGSDPNGPRAPDAS